jgi:hypothetical protein
MSTHLMDALQGHTNGKIVKLLDLLKQQLDRMEAKIDAINQEGKAPRYVYFDTKGNEKE